MVQITGADVFLLPKKDSPLPISPGVIVFLDAPPTQHKADFKPARKSFPHKP